MNELALFAGAGGGILGGKLLGWRTVCAVELDPYARNILIARQDDGCFEPFPIWDDVRTFDGHPWRGVVDIVTGGFPCQDVASVGTKLGINGNRSGLWTEMARIIGEVRPQFVLVENSPDLVARGFGVVLGNLAALGYDAQWGVLGAVHVGAPHRRHRIWICATLRNPASSRCDGRTLGSQHDQEGQPMPGTGNREMANAPRNALEEQRLSAEGRELVGDVTGSRWVREDTNARSEWWTTEPDVGRVAHGVAARVDRLRCTGNGQVPAVVALAWKTLR